MAQWSSAMNNEYLDGNNAPRSAQFALTRSLTTLARLHPHIRLFVIADNPTAPQLSPGIAARAIHLGKQQPTGIAREEYQAQLNAFRPVLSDLEKLPDVRVIPLADLLCNRDFCQSVIANEPL